MHYKIGGVVVVSLAAILFAANSNHPVVPNTQYTDSTRISEISTAPTHTNKLANTSDTEHERLRLEEEFMNSIRTPRGFIDTEAVNKFALENGLIDAKDYNDMEQEICVGDLAVFLKRLAEYYPKVPDGFGEKVKKEEIDLTKVDKRAYTKELSYCVNRGFLTSKGASDYTKPVTLNELTRFIYNTGLNGLPFNTPDDTTIDVAIDAVNGVVTREDSACRIAKLVFMNQYDLIPYTYRGEFQMGRLVTKQDLINILITYIDVLDIYGLHTDNPNSGCAPCADTALVLEREKYNE